MIYIVKYLNYIDFIMIKTLSNRFRNADEAFQYWYQTIEHYGTDFAGTKALFNIGFQLDKPEEMIIKQPWRKWNPDYAAAEWAWYMTGDRNINTLDKVITMLRRNPDTRQAAISIYDGKEIYKYEYDTPCTYAIQFTVVDNKLNMCVTMRSNDLWYGFCNDQYCFAQLQILVAERTGYELGTYYHFAHNLHLYEKDLGKFLPQQSSSLLKRKHEEYG